jgi:hypothetical protein
MFIFQNFWLQGSDFLRDKIVLGQTVLSEGMLHHQAIRNKLFYPHAAYFPLNSAEEKITQKSEGLLGYGPWLV